MLHVKLQIYLKRQVKSKRFVCHGICITVDIPFLPNKSCHGQMLSSHTLTCKPWNLTILIGLLVYDYISFPVSYLSLWVRPSESLWVWLWLQQKYFYLNNTFTKNSHLVLAKMLHLAKPCWYVSFKLIKVTFTPLPFSHITFKFQYFEWNKSKIYVSRWPPYL